jgi:hypothetical protein
MEASESRALSRRASMPGRPPGEYSAGADEAQEFMAGALWASETRVIGMYTPHGQTAFALTAAVPTGHQRALDRLLADCERSTITGQLHITSRWSTLMPEPPDQSKSLARLDLLLAKRSLPRPLEARVVFHLATFGVNMWAACLTTRLLLIREPTFRRRVRGHADPDAQTGLKIEGVGGCETLRAALEKAGIADELFEGRYA